MWGNALGNVGRLIAVSVDEARKLANEPVFSGGGPMGETDPIVVEARRKLAIDDLGDRVFILKLGATIRVVYISRILGTGGAFGGVVDVVAFGLFIDGIDFVLLPVNTGSLGWGWCAT